MTPIYMTVAECVAWFRAAGFVEPDTDDVDDYAIWLDEWLSENEGTVVNGMRVVRAGRRWTLEAAI